MSDSHIIPLNKPDAGDPLYTILKEGAQQLLAQAVEAEIASFLAKDNTEASAATVVRNGYLPERTIQTGLGMLRLESLKPAIEIRQGLSLIAP